MINILIQYMKSYKSLFFVLIIQSLFLNFSCSYILEEDISKDEIQIKYPSEGYSSEGSIIIFGWEDIIGAREYRLLIVSPSFDVIDEVVIDSVLTKNEIHLSLEPGNYQWRVVGRNSAYQAIPSSNYNLTILERSELNE